MKVFLGGTHQTTNEAGEPTGWHKFSVELDEGDLDRLLHEHTTNGHSDLMRDRLADDLRTSEVFQLLTAEATRLVVAEAVTRGLRSPDDMKAATGKVALVADTVLDKVAVRQG
jgi:hypothetical protein